MPHKSGYSEYGSKGGKQGNSMAPSIAEYKSIAKPKKIPRGDDRTRANSNRGVQKPSKSMGY